MRELFLAEVTRLLTVRNLNLCLRELTEFAGVLFRNSRNVALAVARGIQSGSS